MSVSAPLPLISENIPLALREGNRFVAWRSEDRAGQPKPAKMPYSPPAPKGASSSAPADWVSFERAVKYAAVAGLDGIMRAFDHADNLVGIDLDNCLDPEIVNPTVDDLAPWASLIVKRCDTYTEVSPSGTGVKMWMYATLPPHGRKRGDVEMYGSAEGQTGPCGRFFTMTGHHLPGTPATVGYRPDVVLAIHRETFGEGPDVTITPADPDRPIAALEIGDEDVIRLAAESAHNGERFRRLWSGDSSDYAVDGNDGVSEADCALFEILAYYGGPDPARIERLARRSDRAREKWDRHKTYLRDSIRFTISGKTRFYGDAARNAPKLVMGTDGASVCSCGCQNCAREIAEYRESNRDLLVWVERENERAEDLLMRNGLLSQKLTHITNLRAIERRMELDKQRIRRKLKPMQAESLIAVATIGPPMANSVGANPYVTADAIAKVAGGKAATVRNNLRVLDLPGSPVERVTVPMGPKSLTAYNFAGMDTPDLLTALGDFAEQMDAPPKLSPARPTCSKCPEGTSQTVATICDGCRSVLQRRTVAAPANVQENTTLDTGIPPTVSVRTYRDEKHHVAEQREPVNIGRIRVERSVENGIRTERMIVSEVAGRRDVDTTGNCSACGDYTSHRTRSGVTTCSGCGATLAAADWAAQPPSGPPTRCPVPGCRAMEFKPYADGSWRCLKSAHDPSLYELATVAGGSE